MFLLLWTPGKSLYKAMNIYCKMSASNASPKVKVGILKKIFMKRLWKNIWSQTDLRRSFSFSKIISRHIISQLRCRKNV